MTSSAFASAASGNSVLVSETNVERLQLVGRIRASTFLMGGSRSDGELMSGPNPYDMMAASLAACTAMTIRLYSERKSFPLGRVQVNVAHQRASASARDVFERTILLEGDLDQKILDRLLQVADLCPVGKTLGAGADIRTTLGPIDNVPAAASDYLEHAAALEIPNVDW